MTSFAPSGPRALPVVMILGSCVSLQFGAAFATMLFPSLGSWAVTALRLALATLLLGGLVRPAVARWSRGQWRDVVLYGLALGGMNGSFYFALARIPLGAAVAIEFLGPLALSAVLSRRRLDLTCVGIAVAGVSLFGLDDLRGVSALDPIGVGAALVAGAFWAAYVLTSARVGTSVPGLGGLVVAMGVGALALLPLGAPGVVRAVTEPHLLLAALGCAVLASVVPYALELSALRRLPSHVFGILLSLEPAVAGVAGLLLLGQTLTPFGVLAIALVVAASTLATVGAPAAPTPALDPDHDAVPALG